MMHKTSEIKARLKDLLSAREQIVATWEGGSAATGYLDQYSDLDLSIVIADENTEPVFDLLNQHFSELYGIERQFRIPEPAWHGMSQCFYLLRDCEEFFYCDIAVVPASNPHKLTEPDRHGNAVIWFDKEAIYTAVDTPQADQDKLIIRILKGVSAIDFLSIIELRKALTRDNWIASQMNYQIFLSRHLVPLMNIKYRPAKADFGIRYTDRDFPGDVALELEDLLRISCVEDIRQKSRIAIDTYLELKAELTAKYLPAEQD